MVKIEQDKLEIRLMRESDLQAIIEIDERVTSNKRPEYYERKVASMLDKKASIASSLVAEYDGQVVGFVMGNIYIGEFGIPQTTAALDTIGIDPEYKEKIFEIFHQLEPENSTGEGLGLTIVQRILQRHNGKIWLESEPGTGSRFYISLPGI